MADLMYIIYMIHRPFVTLALTLSGSFFLTVHAEDIDDMFNLSLEELLNLKITGSTLTPLDLKDVPSSVTVFNREGMDRLSFDYLNELMLVVPGYQSYRTSNSSIDSAHSSRGRRIGISNSDILYVLDGQRMNNGGSGGVSIGLQHFPLELLEQVEFIRGPGSAIYGSNAMMGVVNMKTRSGVNEFDLSFGDFGNARAHAFVSKSNDNWTVDFFTRIESDQGDQYRVPDNFSTDTIDIKDPYSKWDNYFKLKYQDTLFSIFYSKTKSDGFYTAETNSQNINTREDQIIVTQIQHDFSWNDVESLIRLGYNHSEVVNMSSQITAAGDFEFISNPTSTQAARFDSNTPYSEFNIIWSNDYTINDSSNIQFGAEYRHLYSSGSIISYNFDLEALGRGDIPIGSSTETEFDSVFVLPKKRDVFGLYIQNQYKLSQQFQLFSGLRYDRFSSIGGQLSPRLSMVYNLNDHQIFKVLYAHAFRAPTDTETGAANRVNQVANPRLNPETVKSTEFIWIIQHTQFTSTIGYFYNTFENAIVQEGNELNLLHTVNADVKPSQGVESEFLYQINDDWRSRLTYTYMINDSDTSYREADTLGSAMIDYSSWPWTVNLSIAYQGTREAPTTSGTRQTLDDHFLLFGKVNYQINDDFKVYFKIKNILDKEYDSPSIFDGEETPSVPNRGRELFIGLNYIF